MMTSDGTIPPPPPNYATAIALSEQRDTTTRQAATMTEDMGREESGDDTTCPRGLLGYR